MRILCMQKKSSFDLQIKLHGNVYEDFLFEKLFFFWNSDTWNIQFKNKTPKQSIHSVPKWPRSTKKKKRSHRKFYIFNKNYKFVKFLNVGSASCVTVTQSLKVLQGILYSLPGTRAGGIPVQSRVLILKLHACSYSWTLEKLDHSHSLQQFTMGYKDKLITFSL